jgi:hypothetical protein
MAEELGLPFVDRLISADMSQQVVSDQRSKEGLIEGEQAATPTGRFLSYFARAASVGAVMAPDPMLEDDESIRERAEAALRDVKLGAPAVILGRAAAVVLGSRPRAYHIRLDGPVERRLAWAAEFEGLGRDAASRRCTETDRTRAAFVKRLYRADPADPKQYHLLLDPTVLGIDRSLHVLLTAARGFFEANP